MSPPAATEAADIQLQLTILIYRPRKDERLSWPSWLTYSGWYTHISGHPSATGRAQDSESTSAPKTDVIPLDHATNWTVKPLQSPRCVRNLTCDPSGTSEPSYCSMYNGPSLWTSVSPHRTATISDCAVLHPALPKFFSVCATQEDRLNRHHSLSWLLTT